MTLPACDQIIELSEKATPGPWLTKPTPNSPDGWATCVAIAATAPGKANMIFAQPPGGTYPSADRDFIAESRTLAPKIALALNEAVRAIEEAPHGFDCSYFRNSCRENDGTITRGNCNCWKRTALDRINELLTHP